jgi:hypothetical protein
MEHTPRYWRSSEHAARLISEISSKDAIIEQRVMSFVVPEDMQGFSHLSL